MNNVLPNLSISVLIFYSVKSGNSFEKDTCKMGPILNVSCFLTYIDLFHIKQNMATLAFYISMV